MPPRSGSGRGSGALGAHRQGPAVHGVDAVGDRVLDRRPVRHAAREVGKFDQVAAALVLEQRPDGEGSGAPGIMLASHDRRNARIRECPRWGVHSPGARGESFA
jgi:hypothetical protein